MDTDYSTLAERYLRISEQVAGEIRVEKDAIACAVLGSAARGDVHPKSDIDLLVVVEGSGVYEWERRILQNIVVNIALRSQDVLEKMAQDHADTILALRSARILYDPEGILGTVISKATMAGAVEAEFLADLLDEARSFLGKSERALAEHDLESSVLCLRQGATKLAELMFYEQMGRRINPMRFWQEIQTIPSPKGFRELFARVQGFQAVERDWLVEMHEKLETFLPKPGGVARSADTATRE